MTSLSRSQNVKLSHYKSDFSLSMLNSCIFSFLELIWFVCSWVLCFVLFFIVFDLFGFFFFGGGLFYFCFLFLFLGHFFFGFDLVCFDLVSRTATDFQLQQISVSYSHFLWFPLTFSICFSSSFRTTCLKSKVSNLLLIFTFCGVLCVNCSFFIKCIFQCFKFYLFFIMQNEKIATKFIFLRCFMC